MKSIKKFGVILLLVIFSSFTLISCSDKNLPEAKGYQWKVTKDGEEMYLIGTIHVTDPRYDYLNETIENILKDSNGLAVEVDITSDEVLNKAQKFITLPAGESIEDYLNDEEVLKLKSICNEINLKYENLKSLTPSSILTNLELVASILTGSNGEAVDSQLLNNIKADKKEVIELENVEDQYAILNELYTIDMLKDFLATQEENKFIESTKDAQNSVKELAEAYISGDDIYLENQVRETLNSDSNYYDIMLKNRNIEMVNNIDTVFEKEGTHIIAVGALHYYGDHGIVPLLEDKGYTVERL